MEEFDILGILLKPYLNEIRFQNLIKKEEEGSLFPCAVSLDLLSSFSFRVITCLDY